MSLDLISWQEELVLTESLQLIKADCALALRRLDAARVENMVALEKPDLLLVPFKVELELAVVATILFVNDALC